MWSRIDANRVNLLKGRESVTIEDIKAERKHKERQERFLEEWERG